ncbi:ribonuclease H family protein [Clostridium perfringens]|uniref:ribonuclease H1 domain-containing protein n=1 Tax=Clostridium perfringens TaxID=1502 RepID=UPI00115B6348|nr:ribonuclease H family protein [Clostridium perfringens]EGT0696896.1 ribonuclease H [Clostridium perfringens]EGT3602538.1 ribonuclease H [Clostridium perfringens]EJT5913464.1 ribonuclease H family protein [Clostridium perfringens]MDH5082620.1 ribonuclease H [Clostridium perfringens]MDK0558816.1 ribonuclease H family protein [Clostridium perfringens]
MAKKYYAIAKGKSGIPKIVETWTECQKEVIGCKGAKYKSFASKEEAEKFISIHENGGSFEEVKGNEEVKDDLIYIYVDGSFMVSKENYSYGFLVVKNDEILYEDNGVGYDKEAIALRNVSGEVEGAMKAIEYAIENGYKDIVLCYDYQGIESWALGTWKRNNRITQNYNEFMQEKFKIIKVRFKKIKGHSGNKFNDRADILAKKALESL